MKINRKTGLARLMKQVDRVETMGQLDSFYINTNRPESEFHNIIKSIGVENQKLFINYVNRRAYELDLGE